MKGDVFTFGPRAAFSPSKHWLAYLEGVYQWGEENGRKLDAYGFNAKVSYRLQDMLHNEFWVGYEYLSGDDPKTPENEEFNLLWGVWPRWSELFLYLGGRGERQATMPTNLQRVGAGWSVRPAKRLAFSLGYHAVFAAESASGASALDPRLFSRRDNFRGHLLQAFLRCQFNRYWSSHLYGELLFPGNFYKSDNTFSFLRAEMMFRF